MTAAEETDAGRTAASRSTGVVLETERGEAGLILRISGRLDARTTGTIWKEALSVIDEQAGSVRVNASRIDYCDGVGLALLMRLKQRARELGGRALIEDLPDRFRKLLDQFSLEDLSPREPAPRRFSPISGIGRGASSVWHEAGEHVTFIGRVAAALPAALAGRKHVRWREMLRFVEEVGAGTVPLVAMISFLVGAVISLKAAHSLMQFGELTGMASFNVKAMTSELAAILSTIIVVGRSTSAFAAELSVMRVNEELDALIVMGIDPVPYLVINRVLAGAVSVPLLTLFFAVFGIIGGLAIWLSFGFSAQSYLVQVRQSLMLKDMLGTLVKAVTYGILAAMLGCFYGLRRSARGGAEGVAAAATRAMVVGMVVIALADTAFAVLFYVLKV
jgi:phospholipid/cholesterol/gamma-HCH transport system permease protein